jgi:hypothetical protein
MVYNGHNFTRFARLLKIVRYMLEFNLYMPCKLLSNQTSDTRAIQDARYNDAQQQWFLLSHAPAAGAMYLRLHCYTRHR